MSFRDPGYCPSLDDWQPDGSLAPLEAHEVRVLCVDLGPRNQLDDELCSFAEWRFLSEQERARALRLVRPRDGRRFLICRAALRIILGRILDAPAESIVFRFGPGGKPELAPADASEGSRSLRFNVTHSGDLALVAVCRERELGVDLERVRTISEASRIVESYFTSAEQAQFAGLPPSKQALAFLRGWTRKEAILKAKGVGLAGLATGYETMFGTTELTRRFTPASPLPWIQHWSLWEAAPREDYVAALAVQFVASPT
jgi:4'-phosphopantetheinyl transferase